MEKQDASLPYRIIVGLEVHVELNTRTKMFCRCLNDPFGTPPNTHICPNCTGLPGTLPVPNREAVRKSILVGKALGSTINRLSKWDRKHYFYPDLPKGYQISQYDQPLCSGGALDLLDGQGGAAATIRFERVHLEEDAGKLVHGSKPGSTLVDLNRAGVPLIEMVTKPDLTSAEQARRFLQELRLLVRTLGVSNADMEKGQMRCDVNINIAFPEGTGEVKTPITEVKNVNSFRSVERAITLESQRQYDEWQAGGAIRKRTGKITVGWDEETSVLSLQRAKEAAQDYRYFPEPDLPPVQVYEEDDLNPERMVLPELPNQRRSCYLAAGVGPADVEVLVADPEKHSRFDRLVAASQKQQKSANAPVSAAAKQVANWLINAPAVAELSDADLLDLLAVTAAGEANFASVKARLSEIVALRTASRPVKDIRTALQTLHLLVSHDESVAEAAVAKVFAAQADAVAQVRAGNQRVLGFLVGQVMKETAGKASPQRIQELVRQAIER